MQTNDQYAQARKSTKEFFRFYLGVRDIMAFSSQMTSVLWSDVTTIYDVNENICNINLLYYFYSISSNHPQ